jgi:hypothetical protein
LQILARFRSSSPLRICEQAACQRDPRNLRSNATATRADSESELNLQRSGVRFLFELQWQAQRHARLERVPEHVCQLR